MKLTRSRLEEMVIRALNETAAEVKAETLKGKVLARLQEFLKGLEDLKMSNVADLSGALDEISRINDTDTDKSSGTIDFKIIGSNDGAAAGNAESPAGGGKKENPYEPTNEEKKHIETIKQKIAEKGKGNPIEMTPGESEMIDRLREEGVDIEKLLKSDGSSGGEGGEKSDEAPDGKKKPESSGRRRIGPLLAEVKRIGRRAPKRKQR